jgi:hypothetical protein
MRLGLTVYPVRIFRIISHTSHFWVCRTICGHVQVLKCGRSKLAEEGCDGLS